MRTSEVLNKAADLIEERGWTYGGGWNEEGTSELCLEGGILAALGLSYEDTAATEEGYSEFVKCPAYRAVQEYLDLGDEGRLWSWNDDVRWNAHKPVRRTKEEVVAVLRGAAMVESIKEVSREEVTA